MEFKFQILSPDEWAHYSSLYNCDTLKAGKSFLNSLADTYNLKILHVAIKQKEDLCILTSFLIKDKRILSPNHYYYQFFWQNPDKSQWHHTEVLYFLLDELKKSYKTINIRLPITIKDIRPFKWQGFTIEIRYTLVKYLNDGKLHKNLSRILKNDINANGYKFETNTFWKESLAFHNKELKNFKFAKTYIQQVIRWFSALQQANLAYTFNVFYKDEFVSSIIAIVDEKDKKAYFPLIGTVKEHSSKGISSFLYQYALNQLKDFGVEKVDLYGADMREIATFKQKFEPELQNFYVAKYSAYDNKLQNLTMYLKTFVKKIVR